jgi:hypothetical protein
MPLTDPALELVFSFLLEEKGELRLVARPACRLLQARRMRGFDHVALRVSRMGLEWAMKERAFFERTCNHYHLELRRLQLRMQRADRFRNEPLSMRDPFELLEDEVVWYV